MCKLFSKINIYIPIYVIIVLEKNEICRLHKVKGVEV